MRLTSRAGEAELAVFHWCSSRWPTSARRRATLADRYRTHVEMPLRAARGSCRSSPKRRARLPRLKKPRYDLLHKYLRAHLPEMKDLGEDFPSAERFDAYGFRSLGFLLVGGGRMLLMHAQDAKGVHVFWLSAAGFEKSVFFPADPFPEHQLRAEGEKLVLLRTVAEKLVVEEMLWWGP